MRIVGLACLKKKYISYLKRPEKFVIKHQGKSSDNNCIILEYTRIKA